MDALITKSGDQVPCLRCPSVKINGLVNGLILVSLLVDKKPFSEGLFFIGGKCLETGYPTGTEA